MPVTLTIDPARTEDNGYHDTGIYIRAKHPSTDRWGSYDIVNLTKESLLAWLRGHGGDNPVAENTVGILLGYGHLHEYSEEE